MTTTKTIFYAIFTLILFVVGHILFFNVGQENFVNSTSMNYGVGWEKNKSLYAGSELHFIFSNSKNVTFGISTNSKADQGIEVHIDNSTYLLPSSIKEVKKLSINIDKNTSHTVTVKHFCTYLYDPCEITINQIVLDKNVRFSQYLNHHKILSVLGDSISTMYGLQNYSEITANNFGYEFHNASIMGSTISQVAGFDSASLRYRKDLMSFKSDVIVIFLGTNDVKAKVDLNVFERNYNEIVSSVKQYNPHATILLTGILPRRDIAYSTIQPYNNTIKGIAAKTNTIYVDTASWLTKDSDYADDIHPSQDGQKKLAQNFTKILTSLPN